MRRVHARFVLYDVQKNRIPNTNEYPKKKLHSGLLLRGRGDNIRQLYFVNWYSDRIQQKTCDQETWPMGFGIWLDKCQVEIKLNIHGNRRKHAVQQKKSNARKKKENDRRRPHDHAPARCGSFLLTRKRRKQQDGTSWSRAVTMWIVFHINEINTYTPEAVHFTLISSSIRHTRRHIYTQCYIFDKTKQVLTACERNSLKKQMIVKIIALCY